MKIKRLYSILYTENEELKERTVSVFNMSDIFSLPSYFNGKANDIRAIIFLEKIEDIE